MARKIPTASRVCELLDYDKATGVFRGKIRRANIPAGAIAGCKNRTYTIISIDNCLYRAHQIAWLWVTGKWPDKFIDHINLNKHDNRFCNLRLASKSQNQANSLAPKHNTSGLKGAQRYRAGESYGKPWQSTIAVNGVSKSLGHFATAQEAHAAYAAAANQYFGEFARAS